METKQISTSLKEYVAFLREQERSDNTIGKYIRDIKCFFSYAKGKQLCKNTLLEWKNTLVQSYAPSSVNSMLAAVNSFFCWMQMPEYKVKPLKIQKDIYAKPEKELTQKEYYKLVQAAEKEQNTRLSLLLQTLCSTGIRVSELRFITAAAVKAGYATVNCKGKNRTVFLPKELLKLLSCYCSEKHIKKGPVFQTRSGAPLDRSNIWRDMKKLCQSAGVSREKVFPHNCRHLFARTYYTMEKDLSRLADLLGHTSVATTRIYTMESGSKHLRQLEKMGLVYSKKITT